MAQPAAASPMSEDWPAGNLVGSQIGRYKLLEQIGEGGMGVVYVAEQTQPLRRKVALKLIKPGMDSRQVIARFEAERQALALMDHPNIAKVLDAGTIGEPGALAPGGTPPAYAGGSPGRPYFVMELVRGISITDYCDQVRATPRQRLELFVSVCQAVQHAHQKGIIHRDLKPSNVLVTLHDGAPVVKVIDFGVAKALHQQLAEHTIYTQFSQMIGTPLYMSPEQAELSGLDIDTRSDVYSLGVLLYELLTGQTPFDAETLRNAGFDEMRRMIREDEPPRPSARLSTLGAPAISTLAQDRGLDERRLKRTLRGELDWIVMKALEKDRTRRYESASNFAADVQRYLNDDPVLASPPSIAYRLQKTTRRYKMALTTASIIIAALIVSTTVSLWYAREAQSSRKTAEQRLADAKAALKQSDVDFERALTAVHTMQTQVAGRYHRVAMTPQLAGVRGQLLEAALKFYDELPAKRKDNPTVRFHKAETHLVAHDVYNFLRRPGGSLHTRQAVDLLTRLVKDDPQNLEFRWMLARAYAHRGFSDVSLGEKTVAHHRAIEVGESFLRDSTDPDACNALRLHVAAAYMGLGQWTEDPQQAEQYLKQAIAQCGTLEEASGVQGMSYGHLAVNARSCGNLNQAEEHVREAIRLHNAYIANAPEYIMRRNLCENRQLLGEILLETGRSVEAETVLSEGLVQAGKLASEFPGTMQLGGLMRALDRCAQRNDSQSELIDLLNDLARQHPRCSALHLERAKRLCDVKGDDERLAALTAEIEKYSQVGAYYVQRALIHQRLSHPQLAVQDLRHAIDMEKADVSALNAIGLVCFEIEYYAETLSAIDHAIKLQPDVGWLRAFRGKVFYRQEQFDKARQEFDLAAQLDSLPR
ncbi:MAG: protein kinase [Pirellulaceae bacterium]